MKLNVILFLTFTMNVLYFAQASYLTTGQLALINSLNIQDIFLCFSNRYKSMPEVIRIFPSQILLTGDQKDPSKLSDKQLVTVVYNKLPILHPSGPLTRTALHGFPRELSVLLNTNILANVITPLFTIKEPQTRKQYQILKIYVSESGNLYIISKCSTATGNFDVNNYNQSTEQSLQDLQYEIRAGRLSDSAIFANVMDFNYLYLSQLLNRPELLHSPGLNTKTKTRNLQGLEQYLENKAIVNAILDHLIEMYQRYSSVSEFSEKIKYIEANRAMLVDLISTSTSLLTTKNNVKTTCIIRPEVLTSPLRERMIEKERYKLYRRVVPKLINQYQIYTGSGDVDTSFISKLTNAELDQVYKLFFMDLEQITNRIDQDPQFKESLGLAYPYLIQYVNDTQKTEVVHKIVGWALQDPQFAKELRQINTLAVQSNAQIGPFEDLLISEPTGRYSYLKLSIKKFFEQPVYLQIIKILLTGVFLFLTWSIFYLTYEFVKKLIHTQVELLTYSKTSIQNVKQFNYILDKIGLQSLLLFIGVSTIVFFFILIMGLRVLQSIKSKKEDEEEPLTQS